MKSQFAEMGTATFSGFLHPSMCEVDTKKVSANLRLTLHTTIEPIVRAHRDEQLIERLSNDGARSFLHVYHQFKHRVYAYCYRLLRQPQNAEDATQETFVKVHRSLDTLENAASLQSWIFSIARNEAFTILRRQRPTAELEEETEDVWDEENPLAKVVQKERAGMIQHCLGLLKPSYRELLILREYEELSYAEISTITGASESAVKSGLFKARRAVRKKLDAILEERNEL
jgi:RNA polymerase sigma-70 factor (ECF subfamily)